MRSRSRIVPPVFLGALAGLVLAGAAGALETGQKAPDFTLKAADGKDVRLADLLGKGPVVIYTYIAAFTDA
jgi:peroxiredoxin Q/BCP